MHIDKDIYKQRTPTLIVLVLTLQELNHRTTIFTHISFPWELEGAKLPLYKVAVQYL